MPFKPGQSKPQISHNGEFMLEEAFVQEAYFHHLATQTTVIENIRGYGSTLFWFDEHYTLLCHKLKLIGYTLPTGFEKSKIQQEIIRLINKGKFFQGIMVQLLILPGNQLSEYIIRIDPGHKEAFTLNEKGIRIHVYTKNHKRTHKFSPFYESDLYLKRLGEVFCLKNQLDDCLFINTEKQLLESLRGNFFLIKNNCLQTPPLLDGAMHTPIRSAVIQIIQEQKIAFEEKSIGIDDLEQATELFLCDTWKGLQWVVAFNMKRYFNKTTKQIARALQENAFTQKPLRYKPF